MPHYTCDLCEFSTILKGNYKLHLTSKKHLENIEKNTVYFKCKYCDKQYKHRQSVTKHIKYSCTKNNNEDLLELVRLMNLQIEQQKNDFDDKLKIQEKQIQKLKNKLDIKGSFNTNSNNGNNTVTNITLNNYRNTDVSHLTDADYMKCVKKVFFCVLEMIQKVHFNPDKPENMNMYISNMKDKYMMLYEEDKWILKNKNELENIYEEKELLIEEWIQDHKDPEMVRCFERYMLLKDKDPEKLLEEFKLILFNKKDMIPN